MSLESSWLFWLRGLEVEAYTGTIGGVKKGVCFDATNLVLAAITLIESRQWRLLCPTKPVSFCVATGDFGAPQAKGTSVPRGNGARLFPTWREGLWIATTLAAV